MKIDMYKSLPFNSLMTFISAILMSASIKAAEVKVAVAGNFAQPMKDIAAEF